NEQRIERIIDRARRADGHAKKHADYNCDEEARERRHQRLPGMQQQQFLEFVGGLKDAGRRRQHELRDMESAAGYFPYRQEGERDQPGPQVLDNLGAGAELGGHSDLTAAISARNSLTRSV